MNHFDIQKGWEHTKPGWYEITIHVPEQAEPVTKHLDILKWMYDNIGKCEHHCRWMYDINNTLRYKFRYERNYLWFKLTWE